ncbi:glycoside hydrolase family 5 protein [Rhizomicrobium electricum]|uniref:Glycoside hydrolase family 5 protein n=1 Tax=Rhizomicrobium electricum TaxID=480070 RepID=A0ABP3PGE9_9PROT|nr:glycoside hydrolase family 5 protein [Rhizomicrobium electricum]NIJ48273.1 aryl-phospho-beta-D-glucosidase BglC (GH1 family) [Rhizomicrobium electricum]
MDIGRRQILLSTAALTVLGASGGAAWSAGPALYPSYNTNPRPADPSGMTSTAADIARRIRLGTNIGNTLEAIGGETGWGNPLITQGLINVYKAAGFDAIRLPCAWDQYADQTTAKIRESWLNRVKEIVQYCFNAGLTVVLNIHWDGGWLENNIKPEKKDAVIAKQKAFWEQIATHFRDFDEHLIFASANEPNCDTAEQMEVLYAYHQTFIDAVRSTGGKNAWRVLVLQAPNTGIDMAQKLWTRMPVDTVPNRLMLEVHYYSPPTFCILSEDASWGRVAYYWGKDFHSTTEPDRNATFGEEEAVDQQMALAKQMFTSKGIPVVLGEFGAPIHKQARDLKLSLASRAHWMEYVTRQARANGLLPFLWDIGDLIDRRTGAVKDPQGLEALLKGAGKL